MEENGPHRSSILDAEAFSALVYSLGGQEAARFDFGWQGCGERLVASGDDAFSG
jgi:hypothetical protein